ncbi:hypothetical protein RHECNPAF_122100131 [Rhizobium etli CNPAF512]|nr:hypothetical protein RHECNPAF_122100131 [Rhizobium etli CNPAF512]
MGHYWKSPHTVLTRRRLPQALMTSSCQFCECMMPSCRGLVAC